MIKDKKLQNLINFYLFDKPNAHGDRLSDMWEYDAETLESKHNYIQWMFPTTKRSIFNYKAPKLTKSDLDILLNNDTMIQNIKKSLSVMLNFYGFELRGQYIVKSNDFYAKAKRWTTKNNHNYKRLSRIMECLQSFELYALKRELQNALLSLRNDTWITISTETINIWQNI